MPRKRQKRLFRCQGCNAMAPQRGLCSKCLTDLKHGRMLAGLGFDMVSQEIDRGFDMDGLTSYIVYLEPMLKFSNFHQPLPKAISLGATWYARLNAGHPLHAHFESEFNRAKS